MAANSICYTPSGICGVLFSRLNCAGTLLLGAGNNVQQCSIIDMTMSVEADEPTTLKVTLANGTDCINRGVPGRETSRKFKLSLCPRIDVDLMQLLGLYDFVLDGTNAPRGIQSRGFAAGCVGCGSTSCQGRTALTIWSNNVEPSSSAAFPYVVQVIPSIEWTMTGDRTWKDPRQDPDPIEITGTASANLAWGRGPNQIYPDLGGLTTEWAEFVTAAPWPGGCNCQQCGYTTAANYATLQPGNLGSSRIPGSSGSVQRLATDALADLARDVKSGRAHLTRRDYSTGTAAHAAAPVRPLVTI